ncbi:MAG: hypothetical protein UF734_06450 [Clostridium sp.]|nr:hypothetical protein [Clostridium sp.]
MYRETELRALYDRLKAQYPQYQLDFSGDCLTIARLRSRAVINERANPPAMLGRIV